MSGCKSTRHLPGSLPLRTRGTKMVAPLSTLRPRQLNCSCCGGSVTSLKEYIGAEAVATMIAALVYGNGDSVSYSRGCRKLRSGWSHTWLKMMSLFNVYLTFLYTCVRRFCLVASGMNCRRRTRHTRCFPYPCRLVCQGSQFSRVEATHCCKSCDLAA